LMYLCWLFGHMLLCSAVLCWGHVCIHFVQSLHGHVKARPSQWVLLAECDACCCMCVSQLGFCGCCHCHPHGCHAVSLSAAVCQDWRELCSCYSVVTPCMSFCLVLAGLCKTGSVGVARVFCCVQRYSGCHISIRTRLSLSALLHSTHAFCD
jgi:hypothetical protein